MGLSSYSLKHLQKRTVSQKGQVLIEALLNLLVLLTFIYLLQVFYEISHQSLQQVRLSSRLKVKNIGMNKYRKTQTLKKKDEFPIFEDMNIENTEAVKDFYQSIRRLKKITKEQGWNAYIKDLDQLEITKEQGWNVYIKDLDQLEITK